MSHGCHRLIRDGAKLVETAENMSLGTALARGGDCRGNARSSQTNKKTAAHLDWTKQYEILLDALGFDALGPDALIERSGLKPEAVASMLLILELRGLVEARPGGRYCRSPTTAVK